MLLILMGASLLVFVIACSNIANLILARTIRREGELSIRPARYWVCSAHGQWWAILARYAARFSVRALDLTLDSIMLLIGAALALLAAVLLAYFRACLSPALRNA